MKQPNETAGASAIAPIVNIRVADIMPDPKNQARPVDDAFVASIKREGLLQPIVIRKNPDAKAKAAWMIVAGQRRWEAHGKLKLAEIPARVRPETLQDNALDAVRKRHAENFHREDLSPVQKARALQELFDLKMPQAEIAAFVGAKDQSTVSNFCRMLRLPESVLELVHTGELTAAHAKALLKWEKWPKACALIAQHVIKREMTSKELESQALPFANELSRAKLIFGFSTWDYNADHLEVTAAMKADPDYAILHHTSYCFDEKKLAAEQQRQVPLIAERKKKAATQERAQVSRGATKMTPAQKKARAKQLEENKLNREDVTKRAASALEKIKQSKGVLPEAAAMLAHTVMAFRYNSFVEPAAKALGITLPKNAKGKYGSWNTERLMELGADKFVKLMATTVTMRSLRDAVRNSWECPKTIALIAGKKGGAK